MSLPTAEALFHQGTTCLSERRLGEAETLLRQALAIAPELAEAHANLALALEWGGRLAEAEASYRSALSLQDDNADIQRNLGALLARQHRVAEAEQAYRRAIELAPTSPGHWSNLGVLYASQKQEAAAETCYRTALELDPSHANARFNLAYVLLRQERFDEGWAALEARDWYAALLRLLPCPRWQGESLAGRRLLIGVEAGHGDMIQFARYAEVLKARGAARVDILCHPALVRLFASLKGIGRVLPLDRPLSEAGSDWDYWVPPLSLPYLCGGRPEALPARLPYLYPDPAEVAEWAGRLPIERLKVGLVWRGSSAFENDAERSLPGLATLLPLAATAGVCFVSLQKGAGEAEARQPPDGFRLLEYADLLTDFAATAALVANLDLVIAVDTAVAHLAGALGKPCWVLLPWYQTDWRWLATRDDTPWYPGALTLFRQPARGEWPAVVTRLAAALGAWARR